MLVSKGFPAIHVRAGYLLTVALIVVLCFHISRHWHQHHGSIAVEVNREPIGTPSAEERYLERLTSRYQITNQTEWLAWRIQPAGHEDEQSPLTDVGLNFAPRSLEIINVRGPDRADLRAPRRMTLPARGSGRVGITDVSDFLFGISSTYERIADKDWALLRAWERWLTDAKSSRNGASLVLMLDRATDRQLEEVDEELDARGLNAYLLSTDEPMSMGKRYHELSRIFKTYGATLAASGQRKKWFGLVDDTVFFPSLTHLGERLSKYDANKELYISFSSSSWGWYDQGTTDGSAAVLLTRQAVDRVPRLPCLEATDLEAPAKPKRWDALLKECVKQEAGLDLLVIPASYSPTDNGSEHSRQGVGHEAGTWPLVLHDYKDRHLLDAGMAHLVTEVCGEACFMQHYRFLDDWVLVNGVSIIQHLDGPGRQHRRPRHALRGGLSGQRTVGHAVGRTMGDGHKSDTTWHKKVWRLLDSASTSDGSVWQAYLKRGSVGTEPGEMDSVIVLIWEQSALR